MSFKSIYSDLKIHALNYDITKMHVDIIVNAANGHLQHVGGVAKAIAEAAGWDLERDCNERIHKKGALKVTENYISKSGRLPCRRVMHAVGPDGSKYHSTDQCYRDLYSVFKRCLIDAHTGSKSIAFPAISSGLNLFYC